MPVTVPIVQPERFEISRTDFPEYLSMGEEGYASVSFVNKGKGIIYNVSAEITGDGITKMCIRDRSPSHWRVLQFG